MLAHSAICPEAALTPAEHAAIVVPLTRILDRMPKSTLNKAASWGDPVILVYGLTLWLIRIEGLRRERAAVPQPTMPIEDAMGTAAPHPNGYDATAAQAEQERLEQARAAMGASL